MAHFVHNDETALTAVFAAVACTLDEQIEAVTHLFKAVFDSVVGCNVGLLDGDAKQADSGALPRDNPQRLAEHGFPFGTGYGTPWIGAPSIHVGAMKLDVVM